MISEKLEKKIGTINNEFIKRGYDLKEDLLELVDSYKDIAEKIENTKFKKIEFFSDEENNSVGITLEDVQIEFFIEIGEDEMGPWYEATAEIRYF